MNRNVMLLIGALVLVAIGVGVFALSQRNTSPQEGSPQISEQKPQEEQKSIKDLITSGGSQKCTFKDKSDEYDMEGIAYISDGKVRADLKSSAGGKNILSHMIVENNSLYQWMDGQNIGYKAVFNPDDYASGTEKSTDINQSVDYDCSPSSIDASLFTPPATVKFQELGDTSPTGGQDSGNNCAACNYLQGEQKTQCLQALKCN
jgi:hypothetical protein